MPTVIVESCLKVCSPESLAQAFIKLPLSKSLINTPCTGNLKLLGKFKLIVSVSVELATNCPYTNPIYLL